jgi:hypothetical protein
MLRVIMFDLGMTLIDEHERPFPHVVEALTAIGQMRGERKKPLALSLISDFTMPSPPPTQAKIDDLFAEYLTILERTGLRRFFEPVGAHVTLSTHAGVSKPDPAIFTTALRRLRSRAHLPQCLFITENAAHVAAARDDLKMEALLFGTDFDDWSQAPLLIARMLPAPHNFETALAAHLRAAHRFEPDSLAAGSAPGSFTASGKTWHPVRSPHLGPLDGVMVPLPAHAELTVDPRGHASARVAPPTPDQVAEATNFVESLARQGQIDGHNATHAVEHDSEGHRRLVRRRFNAL